MWEQQQQTVVYRQEEYMWHSQRLVCFDLFKSAAPFWGQNPWNFSDLSRTWYYSSKRVNSLARPEGRSLTLMIGSCRYHKSCVYPKVVRSVSTLSCTQKCWPTTTFLDSVVRCTCYYCCCCCNCCCCSHLVFGFSTNKSFRSDGERRREKIHGENSEGFASVLLYDVSRLGSPVESKSWYV